MRKDRTSREQSKPQQESLGFILEAIAKQQQGIDDPEKCDSLEPSYAKITRLPVKPTIYGTCCKCKKDPATLKSPSSNCIYCEKCGTSRCGIHKITDFQLEESTGLWLDPCVVNRGVKVEQKTLVSEA